MSQCDKLISRIRNLSKDLRYEELKKVLESYGYKETSPRSGSSHYTFRKENYNPITIPKNTTIKRPYVELVKEAIERENKNDKD